MHAPRVQAAIGVPLIHIVDATAREIRKSGAKKVGLLGTRLTMEREFFKHRLNQADLAVVVPDEAERAFIQRTINDELVKSVFLPERKRDFLGIIGRLQAQGAEGVILGCTEIPLLVQQQDAPVPVFDTTRLHALAAVEFALAG